MAIAVVSSTKITPASGGGTTPAIDTTGASLLVMGVTFYKLGTIGSVTDSKGNTWTPLTRRDSTEVAARLYYAQGPTVGSGHTFTFSGTSLFATAFVLALSGTALSSVLDAESGATAGNGVIQPGSITPANNGSVFVSVHGVNGPFGYPHTIDSGFTVSNQNTYAGGVNEGGSLAHLIQGTAAAVNPTWSTGSNPAAAMAVFVPAAVAAKGLPIIAHYHHAVYGGG